MSSDRNVTETPGKAFRAISEFRGVLNAAAWLSLLCVPVLFGACGWLISKVLDGSETNRVQSSEIQAIKERAIEDREENRRFQTAISAQLERIAERVGAAK